MKRIFIKTFLFISLVFTSTAKARLHLQNNFEGLAGCYKVSEIVGYAEAGEQDPEKKSEAGFFALEDFTTLDGKPISSFEFIGRTVLWNRTVYSTFFFPCILPSSGGEIKNLESNVFECSYHQPVLLSGSKFDFELVTQFTSVDARHVEIVGRARLKVNPNEDKPFYKFSAKFLKVECVQ